jgi:hypothetical protein
MIELDELDRDIVNFSFMKGDTFYSNVGSMSSWLREGKKDRIRENA